MHIKILLLILSQNNIDGGISINGNVLVSGDLRANQIIAPYVAASVALESTVLTTGTDNQILTIQGMQSHGAPGPEVRVGSTHERDAGSLEEWFNHNDALNTDIVVAHVDPKGTFVGAIGQTDEQVPAFRGGSGVSGSVMITCADGLYCTIEGQLPSGYTGAHGNLTIIARNPMDAGTMLEINNALHSTTSDKIFNVDHEGGIFALHGMCESQFDACPDVAHRGTIQYDYCEDRWKQCISCGWKKIKLDGDP